MSFCCQAFQDLAPQQEFLQRCSQIQNNTLITQQPYAMGTAIIIDTHPKMSPASWSREFSQVIPTSAVSWDSGGALCSCLNVSGCGLLIKIQSLWMYQVSVYLEGDLDTETLVHPVIFLS